MKKTIIVLAVAAITAASSVQAEVNVNVNVGVPTPRVIVSSPSVRFEVAPLFVAPPSLGFYVGVDTPYDIFFSSDFFYLYYGNSWHRARHHNGPWVELPYRELPYGIRKHRIEQIRSYRDREHRVYRQDRENYRGRSFRAGHERSGEVREDRGHHGDERGDDRRHDRGERNGNDRSDREERKDDHRDGGHQGHGRD